MTFAAVAAAFELVAFAFQVAAKVALTDPPAAILTMSAPITQVGNGIRTGYVKGINPRAAGQRGIAINGVSYLIGCCGSGHG